MSLSEPPAAKRHRSMSSSSTPLAFLSNFNATTYLSKLPFEAILNVASFLRPSDAMSLGCVKGISKDGFEELAFWKQIAWDVDPSGVPDEIVASLIKGKTSQYPNQILYEEAELWRNYALGRSKALSQNFWRSSPKNTPAVHLPPGRHSPKPLGAYSFLLDIEKVNPDGNKKCTVFIENIETESKLGSNLGDVNYLRFRIPDKYLDEYFPWMENDVEDIINRYAGYSCVLDTTFTVYAIDRSSGNHAQIYQSGREAYHWEEGWDFQRKAQSDTKPVTYVYGRIDRPWKHDGLKLLDLFLSMDEGSYTTYTENLLRFLEKGCQSF